MTTTRTISSLAAVATLALATSACAATDDEHASHHPNTATAFRVAQAGPAMQGRPGMQGTQGVDAQMSAMRAMHDKMLAAKTPEERNALMAEQMKLMQGSMSMMNGMGPGAMMGGKPGDAAGRQPMLEQRMDMMQAMMQMMMDRFADMPPAK